MAKASAQPIPPTARREKRIAGSRGATGFAAKGGAIAATTPQIAHKLQRAHAYRTAAGTRSVLRRRLTHFPTIHHGEVISRMIRPRRTTPSNPFVPGLTVAPFPQIPYTVAS